MGKIWKNNPNVPNHQPDIQCGTLKLDPNTNLNLGIVDACKNNWHVGPKKWLELGKQNFVLGIPLVVTSHVFVSGFYPHVLEKSSHFGMILWQKKHLFLKKHVNHVMKSWKIMEDPVELV